MFGQQTEVRGVTRIQSRKKTSCTIRFLVANSNSSFDGGWSLSHVTLQRLRGTEWTEDWEAPLGQKDFLRMKDFC